MKPQGLRLSYWLEARRWADIASGYRSGSGQDAFEVRDGSATELQRDKI